MRAFDLVMQGRRKEERECMRIIQCDEGARAECYWQRLGGGIRDMNRTDKFGGSRSLVMIQVSWEGGFRAGLLVGEVRAGQMEGRRIISFAENPVSNQ